MKGGKVNVIIVAVDGGLPTEVLVITDRAEAETRFIAKVNEICRTSHDTVEAAEEAMEECAFGPEAFLREAVVE